MIHEPLPLWTTDPPPSTGWSDRSLIIPSPICLTLDLSSSPLYSWFHRHVQKRSYTASPGYERRPLTSRWLWHHDGCTRAGLRPRRVGLMPAQRRRCPHQSSAPYSPPTAHLLCPPGCVPLTPSSAALSEGGHPTSAHCNLTAVPFAEPGLRGPNPPSSTVHDTATDPATPR